MGFVKDTFFGGAEKKAARQQQASLKESQELVRQGTEQARRDILNLYPQAQQNILAGLGSAVDLLQSSYPAQAQAFQQGNVAAQNLLAGSLPQFRNAILGGPVDYSFAQPVTIGIPQMQVNLPDYMQPEAIQGMAEKPAIAPQPQRISPLSGRVGSGNFMGNRIRWESR